MAEFEDKIAVAGGRLEFRRDGEGRVSIRITSTSVNFRAMYQIAVSYEGRPLAVVPFMGVGGSTPPYPQPSLLAWIRSDAQGLWGRRCPFCKCYFRTKHVGSGKTVCPYCAQAGDGLKFITDAQGQYAAAFCNALERAHQGPDDVVAIDLYTITDAQPEWNYSEEKQQFHFTCSKCKIQTDILGDYGWCPQCGSTNAEQVVNARIKSSEEEFSFLKSSESDRDKRAQEWERLNVQCFSNLEALANHLRVRLALFPATPKRRAEVLALNFQRLTEAREALRQWFDIDLYAGVSPEDCDFIRLMLHRRHLTVHNGGRADQRYLELSGDSRARLHQRIRIRSRELARLLPLIRKMCANLIEQYDSIS